MSLALFSLSAKFEKPACWFLSISLSDVENAIGAQLTHLTVLRPLTRGNSFHFTGSSKKALFVCAQGDCLVANESDDELTMSGDPDCENCFHGCVTPAQNSFDFVGLSLLPTVILCFSPEPLSIPDRFLCKEFDVAQVGHDLRDSVTSVSIHSIARNGYPAGNQWHAHKKKMLFPLTGAFRIGTISQGMMRLVEYEIRERSMGCKTRIILPHHAYAVRNIAPQTSRLLVLTTGDPNDNDIYDYDIYPSPL